MVVPASIDLKRWNGRSPPAAMALASSDMLDPLPGSFRTGLDAQGQGLVHGELL